MPINTDPHIHENVICANIFVRQGDKYLMLKRSREKKFAPGVVHPIGGKVDKDENPFMAAEREVLEEAGINVKNIRLEAVILEILPPTGAGKDWLIFHFSADYKSGKIKTTEEGELIWLDKKDILGQDLFPSLRYVIKNILNPKDGTVFTTVYYNKKGEVDKKKSFVDRCVV